METNVTLYGASGHGKVIIDILQSCSIGIEAVIDDHPKKETILGIAVQKSTDFNFNDVSAAIISIGNNKVRKMLSNAFKVNYVNAIHPSAIISEFSSLGSGTVVMAGVVVNPDAVIGNHCIINTLAIIEHDCRIDDFVHISPGVALAGNVTIGEGSHIGIGASVIQGVKIGKWTTIGAGAVIIKDVPDYALVVGNPGKIIKYNQHDE